MQMRERLLRYSIATFVAIFGVLGVVAAFAADGANGDPVRMTLMLTAGLSTIPMVLLTARVPLGPMWWSKRPAVRGFNVFFALYADIGVGIVLLSFSNPRVGLHCTALYAVIGAWVAHFVTPRVIAIHLVVSSAIICACGFRAWQSGCSLPTAIGATFVALLATNATVVVLNNYTREFQLSLAAQHTMAHTDPLTGALNRRGFTQQCLQLSSDANGPYTIAMFDIDHYKRINDRHGHAVGDAVLVRVAGAIRDAAGPDAVVARVGGDEFAVAVCADGPGIERIAARVRDHNEDLLTGERVTVSVGAAVLSGPPRGGLPEPIDDLVDRMTAAADAALMQSKSSGRDRVTIIDADPRAADALRR
ncbi:GGDEF domain-containing protein [Gordonia sinesedis]